MRQISVLLRNLSKILKYVGQSVCIFVCLLLYICMFAGLSVCLPGCLRSQFWIKDFSFFSCNIVIREHCQIVMTI